MSRCTGIGAVGSSATVALRHALDVDLLVVAALAERIDAGPEIRPRGEAQLVAGVGLAPDVPGLGMQSPRLLEMMAGGSVLAGPQQMTAEPEMRVRQRDVESSQKETFSMCVVPMPSRAFAWTAIGSIALVVAAGRSRCSPR